MNICINICIFIYVDVIYSEFSIIQGLYGWKSRMINKF